jgi:hypothetical protein
MCGGDVCDCEPQLMPVHESTDEAAAEAGAQETGRTGSAVVAGAVAAAFAAVGRLRCLDMSRVVDRSSTLIHDMAGMHGVVHWRRGVLPGHVLHPAMPLINSARQCRCGNGDHQARDHQGAQKAHQRGVSASLTRFATRGPTHSFRAHGTEAAGAALRTLRELVAGSEDCFQR